MTPDGRRLSRLMALLFMFVVPAIVIVVNAVLLLLQ